MTSSAIETKETSEVALNTVLSAKATDVEQEIKRQRILFVFRSVADNPPARELERHLLAYRLRESV